MPPVLLIDELDRADEPFEAFLLEVLSDFQITIPELGTVKAATPPIVVLTSNRTREIHDAVKRRCLYHWVGFPDAARELLVLQRRVPGVAQQLAQQIVAFVQRLRQVELYKLPGIAETIEWTRALMQLDALVLDPDGDPGHAGRAAEVPGRHRAHARRRSGAAARRGAQRGACCGLMLVSCLSTARRGGRYPAGAPTVAVGLAGRLRCDARSTVARRNSLRSLRSLRSDNRRESVVEARALRAPTALLRFAPPHKSPPPGTARRAERFVVFGEGHGDAGKAVGGCAPERQT